MPSLMYVGQSPNGINVQLYNSYKKVNIRPGINYNFVPNDPDPTTPPAIAHYKSPALRKLGVRYISDVIMDEVKEIVPQDEIPDTELPPEITDPPNGDADNEGDPNGQQSSATFVPPANPADSDGNPPQDPNNQPGEVQQPTDPKVQEDPDLAKFKPNLEELKQSNPDELQEYLEINLPDESYRAIIEKMGIRPGNKRKGTVIRELIGSDRKDEFLTLISE